LFLRRRSLDRFGRDLHSAPSKAFKSMKAFLNRLRPTSKKNKDAHQKIAHSGPPPELPPISFTVATPSPIDPCESPPKLSRPLPPFKRRPPPVIEPSEPSAATSSSPTTTTTTATTVDVNDKVAFVPTPTLPNLSTTKADNAPVRRTITPYLLPNGRYNTDPTSQRVSADVDSNVGLGSRERTRRRILSEIVLSEEK
jgi:hypothetical protein